MAEGTASPTSMAGWMVRPPSSAAACEGDGRPREADSGPLGRCTALAGGGGDGGFARDGAGAAALGAAAPGAAAPGAAAPGCCPPLFSHWYVIIDVSWSSAALTICCCSSCDCGHARPSLVHASRAREQASRAAARSSPHLASMPVDSSKKVMQPSRPSSTAVALRSSCAARPPRLRLLCCVSPPRPLVAGTAAWGVAGCDLACAG